MVQNPLAQAPALPSGEGDSSRSGGPVRHERQQARRAPYPPRPLQPRVGIDLRDPGTPAERQRVRGEFSDKRPCQHNHRTPLGKRGHDNVECKAQQWRLEMDRKKPDSTANMVPAPMPPIQPPGNEITYTPYQAKAQTQVNLNAPIIVTHETVAASLAHVFR